MPSLSRGPQAWREGETEGEAARRTLERARCASHILAKFSTHFRLISCRMSSVERKAFSAFLVGHWHCKWRAMGMGAVLRGGHEVINGVALHWRRGIFFLCSSVWVGLKAVIIALEGGSCSSVCHLVEWQLLITTTPILHVIRPPNKRNTCISIRFTGLFA